MNRENPQNAFPNLRDVISRISNAYGKISYFTFTMVTTIRALETLIPDDLIPGQANYIIFMSFLGALAPVLREGHHNIQNREVDLLPPLELNFNDFSDDEEQIEVNFNNFSDDVEQKSLLVYSQNSENDQRYQAAGLDPDEVPDKLKCPVSDQIFTVPVKPRDSKVEPIELSVLEYWFAQGKRDYPYKQPTHPLTKQALYIERLEVDTKLAARVKNFVDGKIAKKVTRIGNLLICNSRLYAKVEREQLINIQYSVTVRYALIILEHCPPTSFQNVAVGLALFNTFISQVPMPRKQIEESFTVFAQCINFFRDLHDQVAGNSNSQNFSITYQPRISLGVKS